jgi:hypothetical protein
MHSTIPLEVLSGALQFVSYFFTFLAVVVSCCLTGRA